MIVYVVIDSIEGTFYSVHRTLDDAKKNIDNYSPYAVLAWNIDTGEYKRV